VALRNNLAQTDERTLTLARVFDAPRRLVFQAWTQKEHLAKWSAPRGFTIPYLEGDLRPGGRWRCCMRAPEGHELWLSGVYREIVENELLVFTHAWEEDGQPGHETLVTVRFADAGSGTRVAITQTGFESTGARDGHAGGWRECFDLLAEHLARQSSVQQ
jgi:uncharacterized protein YndB with AHSA1/START domain